MIRNNRSDTEQKTAFDDSVLLRRKAEEILKKKTVLSQHKRDFADEKALLHELQVHQIELEMQNEELKRARLEDEILHEKYVDLYDFAPVSYFTIDNNGTIIWVNLTGCRFLKYERQNLIGRRFQSFLIPENLPELAARLFQPEPVSSSCYSVGLPLPHCWPPYCQTAGPFLITHWQPVCQDLWLPFQRHPVCCDIPAHRFRNKKHNRDRFHHYEYHNLAFS